MTDMVIKPFVPVHSSAEPASTKEHLAHLEERVAALEKSTVATTTVLAPVTKHIESLSLSSINWTQIAALLTGLATVIKTLVPATASPSKPPATSADPTAG